MKRRSEHFKDVDVWPSFPPEVVSDAERAQRAEFEVLAHRYVDRRFAADPEGRELVAAMLFAPTVERATYYGRRAS